MGPPFPTRELRKPWESYRVSILYYSTFFSKIKEDGRLFHKKVETLLFGPLCVSCQFVCICSRLVSQCLFSQKSRSGKQTSFPSAFALTALYCQSVHRFAPKYPPRLTLGFSPYRPQCFSAHLHNHQRKRSICYIPRHAAYLFERRPRISEMLRGIAPQNGRYTIYTT